MPINRSIKEQLIYDEISELNNNVFTIKDKANQALLVIGNIFLNHSNKCFSDEMMRNFLNELKKTLNEGSNQQDFFTECLNSGICNELFIESTTKNCGVPKKHFF